jgi:hypothetical protein
MSRRLALAIAVGLIPQFARAELIDRYETGLETFLANFFAFYVSRIPALEGNTPRTEWEEIDRTIGRCVLASYEAEAGAQGVEDFVKRIEALAALQITSNRALMAAMSPIMTDTVANAAAATCGQEQRTQELMAATRMMEILSDPANLALLDD